MTVSCCMLSIHKHQHIFTGLHFWPISFVKCNIWIKTKISASSHKCYHACSYSTKLQTFLKTGISGAVENYRRAGTESFEHIGSFVSMCIIGYWFSLIWARGRIDMLASNTVSALTGCYYNQQIWLYAECSSKSLRWISSLCMCDVTNIPSYSWKNLHQVTDENKSLSLDYN